MPNPTAMLWVWLQNLKYIEPSPGLTLGHTGKLVWVPQGITGGGFVLPPPEKGNKSTMQEQTSGVAPVKGGSKVWRYIKRIAIAIAVLFAILIVALIIDISNDDKNKGATIGQQNQQNEVSSVQIEVTSQIVKKVDGKYRYFFDIRNNDSEDFEGEVTINLLQVDGSKLGENTFNTTKPIAPQLGYSVYFDINTGPVSVFGDLGIEKYTYEVKSGNSVVKTGNGIISDKLEDLSQ